MEKWISRIVLLSLAFMLLSLGIYSYQSWKEKRELKQAVLRYNQLLEKVFIATDPTLIEPYVSTKEIGKIARYVLFLKESNKEMEAKLKEIEFKSIVIKGKKGLIKTNERWAYRYFDIKTKRQIEPWKEVSYLMNYTLYKNSNHWFIGEASVEKEKEIK